MKKAFSIGEAAKIAGTTTETLRHYDRIGLLKPAKEDESGYRIYTQEDIVRINTITALRRMRMSLNEIGEILSKQSIAEVVDGFERALLRADNEIESLNEAKKRIMRAKNYYKDILNAGCIEKIEYFDERKILLSDFLTTPTIDNLNNYHRHFRSQLGGKASLFEFADVAGILRRGDADVMFVECKKWTDDKNLVTLPQGGYLHIITAKEKREEGLRLLREEAKEKNGSECDISLSFVKITGILDWNYDLQVPLFNNYNSKNF